jgi:hypothetical protein
MGNKQTAVEWLVKELEEHHVFHDIQNTNAFQIAKQMEKDQIMDAANTLLYRGTGPGDMWAEQYYNETFKSKSIEEFKKK